MPRAQASIFDSPPLSVTKLLKFVIGPIPALVFVASLGLIGWLIFLQLSGNVHVIDPGQVYRSNTLSPSQLARVLAQYHIRTVLNLRGAEQDAAWHQTEANTISQHGAVLIDLPLIATQKPTDAQMAALLAILRTAPRPLLIHCRAGADRTGLASALYLFVIKYRSAPEAAAQLSWIYGHLPTPWDDTGAMDRAFWQVAASASERSSVAPSVR